MADENKELMKKDLVTILRLNGKIHYDNINEVKKIHIALVEKEILKTSFGNKYIQRLALVIKGEDNKKCLLCNGNLDNSTLICNTCLNKFKKPKVESENKPVAKTEVKNDLKKQPEELNRIIQNIVQCVNRLMKKLGKKTQIALAIFIALVLIGAFLDTETTNTAREAISNGNEAYGLVKEFYSLDDFYISLNETATVPLNIFSGTVGKQVEQSAFTGKEQIGVYCFAVSSKDGRLTGQVWVADNGGVVQFGLDGDGNFYLIK